jgi:hypothetical protein
MGPFEAHRHGLSPSRCTLDRRGKSYLKLPQIKIATEPDKFTRVLLRFEHMQQRPFGMKLLAYTLINVREFCGA